ncbi:hypothetical protein EXD76_06400 [BEV proteobacterium]|nr:hypothetical protein [Candidatus Symbiopectobacterium sp. Chty_BC]
MAKQHDSLLFNKAIDSLQVAGDNPEDSAPVVDDGIPVLPIISASLPWFIVTGFTDPRINYLGGASLLAYATAFGVDA